MGNIVKITAGGPDIEAGVYPAKLTGVSIFDPEDDKGNKTSQYGPSRKWEFDALDEGELVEVDCLTSLFLNSGSRGGQNLTAILGRQPEVGEEVDLDDLVGKPCQVVIGLNKKGTRMTVVQVLPAKKVKA
jgi:hypothetical protein